MKYIELSIRIFKLFKPPVRVIKFSSLKKFGKIKVFSPLLQRVPNRGFKLDKQRNVYRVEAVLNDSRYKGGQFTLNMKSYLANEINAEQYGQKLFNCLFTGEIPEAYHIAMSQVRDIEGRLHVLLEIDSSADELHALSWERIHHDYYGQKVPFAVTEQTPFSRFYSDKRPKPKLITQRPLSMLFVVANPTNLEENLKLDVEEEITNLVGVVNSLYADRASNRDVQLRILPGCTPLSSLLREKLEHDGHEIIPGPASLDNLISQLESPYHILHFVGHGFFNWKENKSGLWLESENGTVDIIEAEKLKKKLTTKQASLGLVFLAACETAKYNYLEYSTMPLGPHLVEAGIPAVVAMRDKISMSLARKLTTEFYRHLLNHGVVDKALNQARHVVWDPDNFDWSTPILFTRIRNGLLFMPQNAGTPPYKGLETFGVEDALLFFGREELALKLTERVSGEKFLAIIGSSGSGKSSLVKAGLIPHLLKKKAWDGLKPEGPIFIEAYCHIITPTSNPMRSLTQAISHYEVANNAPNISRGDQDLATRICNLTTNKIEHRLLLVVDQFEELFTLCKEEEERQKFIDSILETVELDAPVNIIIVLSEGFYNDCAKYSKLRHMIGQHIETIPPMNLAELRRVIEKPAQLFDWELEPQLVDKLLDDIGNAPIALPFLSHALLETWKLRRYKQLTKDGYMDAGGIKHAIAETAERVYINLEPDEREIARNIFLRLTVVDRVSIVTKRRASIERFVDQVHDEAAVKDVIKKLAESRLLIEGDKVEIVHEALLRAWPRLESWLKDRNSLLNLERVLDRTEEWKKLGRDQGGLLRGRTLDELWPWYKDNESLFSPIAKEFMEKSKETDTIESGMRLLNEVPKLTTNREAKKATASLRKTLKNSPHLITTLEYEIEKVRRVVATKLVQAGEAYCAYATARSTQEAVTNSNGSDKQLQKSADNAWANAKSIMQVYGITINSTLTSMAARKHADELFKKALALRPPPDTPVYVWVPSGKFYMGSNHTDADAHSDEFPMHIVDIDGFWIMRVPVTNAQYRQYVLSHTLDWGELEVSDYAQHPVTNVDWKQATEYAMWVGGVLPTEAEWEKACRGGEKIPVDPCEGWSKLEENPFPTRIYPWGNNAPTAEFLNFKQSCTTDVGSYPKGASPYGCLDMSGNVNEWVDDWYHEESYKYSPSHNPPGPEEGSRYAAGVSKVNPILQTKEDTYQRTEVGRVLRGGSYLDEHVAVRCAYRDRITPLLQYGNVGFRVVIPGILNSNSL